MYNVNLASTSEGDGRGVDVINAEPKPYLLLPLLQGPSGAPPFAANRVSACRSAEGYVGRRYARRIQTTVKDIFHRGDIEVERSPTAFAKQVEVTNITGGYL